LQVAELQPFLNELREREAARVAPPAEEGTSVTQMIGRGDPVPQRLMNIATPPGTLVPEMPEPAAEDLHANDLKILTVSIKLGALQMAWGLRSPLVEGIGCHTRSCAVLG
jgi:hypothetical protein